METNAICVRYANSTKELDILGSLWNALHKDHSEIFPALGGQVRPRPFLDAWNPQFDQYRTPTWKEAVEHR